MQKKREEKREDRRIARGEEEINIIIINVVSAGCASHPLG